MKSKAHFKGHPLHPILVSFPIGFLVGTLIFDILGLVANRPAFYNTAMQLEIAGIVTGLIAAGTGLIDLVYTVPPESSGKVRGIKHAFVNASHLIIFTIAWVYRQSMDVSVFVVIGLEVIGVVLLTVAGWLGGTLVYRNQIGVDPRYANAGKWKEISIGEASGKVAVADSGELKPNQMKLIRAKDKRYVLGHTEKGYVAFDDHCTHRGGSLAGGSMICGTVQCPWHGSQFDVHTGEVKAGPATLNINTYKVTESNGKIYIQL